MKTSSVPRRSHLVLATSFLLLSAVCCRAFVVSPAKSPLATTIARSPPVGVLFSLENDNNDVASMRASEIKKELESYGISTKSFLEKTELVDALVKARAEGLEPKQTTTTTTTSSTESSSSTASSSSSSTSQKPREDRLAEEMQTCKAMKNSELKKELEERGISTKSFFEKSEFVKALAEARVDNIRKTTTTSSNDQEEGYAEYNNVEVLTSDDAGPRTKKQAGAQGGRGSSSNPFGNGGSNPFGGGGANPFGGGGSNPFGGGAPGGMGGLGNIADMLKNMGMGGGANPFAGGAGAAGANPFGGGANPFGGGGANPFGGGAGMGDAMGKAQQMMQNPKVMEIIAKAQSNPKVMAAVQECMSNPASFAKYLNDPDVGPIIRELQQYMP